MKRLLLALAMVTMAALPARAVDVGTVLQFNQPVPGCTFSGDAREVVRIRMLYGDFDADLFIRSVGFKQFDGQWRACVWLSPSMEYRVVQKHVTDPGRAYAWYCLESVADFKVGKPGDPPAGPPLVCFWTHAPETSRGTY